jgi:hypothetical protein
MLFMRRIITFVVNRAGLAGGGIALTELSDGALRRRPICGGVHLRHQRAYDGR